MTKPMRRLLETAESNAAGMSSGAASYSENAVWRSSSCSSDEMRVYLRVLNFGDCNVTGCESSSVCESSIWILKLETSIIMQPTAFVDLTVEGFGRSSGETQINQCLSIAAEQLAANCHQRVSGAGAEEAGRLVTGCDCK